MVGLTFLGVVWLLAGMLLGAVITLLAVYMLVIHQVFKL